MNTATLKTSSHEKLFLLGLVILTSSLFMSSFPREFTNWDDPKYVIENPLIRSLSLENLKAIITTPYFCNYAPLTLISYALDYSLGGLNPNVFFLHNIALHLGSILLCFFLLKKFPLPKSAIFLATTLFAIHPTNAESVAWISERKNLLAVFFFLISLLTYIEFSQKRSRPHYLLSLLFYFLSLLAKASTVTASALFILYDCFYGLTVTCFPQSNNSGNNAGCLSLKLEASWSGVIQNIKRVRLYDKLPFLVSAEIISFWTVYAAQAEEALHSYHRNGFLSNIVQVPQLILEYVLLLLLPVNLSPTYLTHETPSLRFFTPWIYTIIFLALVIFLLIQKNKTVLFGFLFFLIFLVPVLNIVPLPIKMSNRYLYLPQIGIWMAWAILSARLVEKLRSFRLLRATAAGLLAIWFIGLGWQTWQFSKTWRNSGALWEAAIEDDYHNPVAHYNLGLYYGSAGSKNRMAVEFLLALNLEPQYSLAHNALGQYFVEKKQFELAQQQFERALLATPDYFSYLINMGHLYLKKGDTQKTLLFWQRAIYINPNDVPAIMNLLLLLTRSQKWDLVQQLAKDMIQNHPLEPRFWAAYAEASEHLGNLEGALQGWREYAKRVVLSDSMKSQIDAKISGITKRLNDR